MEIVIVKQTDARLSEKDAETVRKFLFQSIDGCNDKDRKAWRSFWRAIGTAGSGEFFTISLKRQRSGPFHRLVMLVLQTIHKSQERFEEFKIFRAWAKMGAGFVEYIPDLNGKLNAHPKSQSFDDCSEEECRQFFDDMIAFMRTGTAHRTLWPHLSPQVAEQGMESILQRFERPHT